MDLFDLPIKPTCRRFLISWGPLHYSGCRDVFMQGFFAVIRSKRFSTNRVSPVTPGSFSWTRPCLLVVIASTLRSAALEADNGQMLSRPAHCPAVHVYLLEREPYTG
jgi:hypothetical protein